MNTLHISSSLNCNGLTSRLILAIIVSFTAFSEAKAAHPTSQEEALKCMIFVQTFTANGTPLGRGSGFVANDSGSQWIFTNAHVIEGASRIEFFDITGAKLTAFGRFQCFSIESGTGQHGENRFGGDGVRLELKEPRSMAFKISSNPQAFGKESKVVTIGDNDADRNFEILDGVVTAASNTVIQSTCKTRPGSSGGALIDPDTFEVIGLNTFGISGAIKLADAIWQQGVDENVAGASILSTAKWIDMKAADFLQGSEVAMRFRDTVRMLAFIYTLVPQEDGFKIDPSNQFAANLTFEQAFDKFSQDPILRPVIDLNRRLAGRGGNIGINKMEMVRIYATALVQIRASYAQQRQELTAGLAPYYRIDFQQSGFYEVGDWCYKSLEDAQKWFQQKSRLGGTMPVGRWFNLAPLSEIGK
jgi:hypothetical protein